MSDEPFTSPTYKIPPPEPPKPGEFLCEFLRGPAVKEHSIAHLG
jgi:hypothetical protein